MFTFAAGFVAAFASAAGTATTQPANAQTAKTSRMPRRLKAEPILAEPPQPNP